jgi:hypothetical protein
MEAVKVEAKYGWKTAIEDLEKTAEVTNNDSIYNDGALPVKFQERSMRSFFLDTPQDASGLRTRREECYRQIFLTCASLARTFSQTGTVDPRLQSYATNNLFYHWSLVDPKSHSTEENAEVMEALAIVMSKQLHFAIMAEWVVLRYDDQSSFVGQLFAKIPAWTKIWKEDPELRNLFKSPHESSSAKSAAWWDEVASDESSILNDLTKSHFRRLYIAKETDSALSAYRAIRTTVKAVSKTMTKD